MADDEDEGMSDWLIKAVVIAVLAGALYWFLSPQMRCERAYLENNPDRHYAGSVYCGKQHSW
jgi:hypothetical protein